jgi:hypothetical protein
MNPAAFLSFPRQPGPADSSWALTARRDRELRYAVNRSSFWKIVYRALVEIEKRFAGNGDDGNTEK